MKSLSIATATLAACLGWLSFAANTANAQDTDCRPSACGQRSAAVTLSAGAGYSCMHDVRVYEGNACAGEPIWSTSLGCNEVRRMVVTDDGQLVSLLADRASRRDWGIVRVYTADDGQLIVRSVRLEDLPGVPEDVRRPRLRIDARTLTLELTREVTIEVRTLPTLGRAGARRRLR